MFTTTQNQTQNPTDVKDDNTAKNTSVLQSVKYKSIIQKDDKNISNEIQYSNIDSILEKEKQHNKTEAWNKLDKTAKLQKLHSFAEKYGKDHNIPIKEIKTLKLFFNDCLDKNKLQKTKDVVYDKEKSIITQIPALTLNANTKAYTLKNIDAKRISTIKSLTPHRNSEKKNEDENDKIEEKN
uniref:Uncharacterized protein n=1 Tax=viral metagenome TaxID=1070528 RepID=A0A6C0I0X5_9ZZZZ